MIMNISQKISMIQYTNKTPHPFQPKNITKVMDFDTFVLPDGVGKILGLTVVPLAAAMRNVTIQLEARFF